MCIVLIPFVLYVHLVNLNLPSNQIILFNSDLSPNSDCSLAPSLCGHHCLALSGFACSNDMGRNTHSYQIKQHRTRFQFPIILDQMKLFNYLAAILVPNAFARSAGRFQAGPIDTGLFYDEYLQEWLQNIFSSPYIWLSV